MAESEWKQLFVMHSTPKGKLRWKKLWMQSCLEEGFAENIHKIQVPKLHGLDIPGANAAQLAQGNGHEELAGVPSYKNEVRGKVVVVYHG